MGIKSMGLRGIDWAREKSDALLSLAQLSAVAILFFGAGILWAQHYLFPQESITIREPATGFQAPSQANVLGSLPKAAPEKKTVAPAARTYVASKNGKNYYKLSCRNTIKEANKVYFTSEEDAKKAGFAPSASCFK